MSADAKLEQPPAPRIRGGIGADDAYWTALERGSFKLPRCAACGKWMWPAHYRCGACGAWEIAWVEVDPVGTVYTWTRNFSVSDVIRDRAGDLPYVTLLAEIPAADGARVVGALKGSEAGLRIGAPVRGVIEPASPRSKGYATICWMLAE